MKRNNILAKKRLMKTTTYMTALLVAVSMILSSAATVANVNEANISIEKYVPTAPLNVDDGADTPPEPEPTLGETLEKEIEYSGAYRGVVVYDNGMSYSGTAASHQCSAYDARTADDFVLGSDTDVTGVNWIAGYWNGVGPGFDWEIVFYEDDGTGTTPGAIFAGPFDFANAEIEEIELTAGSYYECRVDLPSAVTFEGGQKYWISAAGTSEFPPQCGMGYHSNAIGHQINFLSVYFGFPTWTNGNIVFGAYYDVGFQLTQAPTHDVYPTEILAPLTGDDFCPCTDVEASFYNGGMVDETDVPVSVEIRRYTMMDSFEDPFGVFWDPIPGGNIWMQSPAESAYPFVVTPRTGVFMAELDSGMTGPGAAWLDSLPIDLSGMCHPMMSFYMWHDEYGSDDFIDVQVNFVDVDGPFYRLCCPDCPTGWIEHVVDLSAYAGTSIILSFEGNCDGNPGAYNLQIDDMSIYDQEYFEEELVDIDAGETVDVEFPQWCPCNWQNPAWAASYFDVEVIACSGLETDEVPSNDCIIEDVTMYMPFFHDIAAISIDEPVANTVPVQTFEMCGTIKNVGQYEECCFSVYMTVEEQYMTVGPDIPQQDILATEGFDTFPPAGWTITYLPPYTYTWERNDYYWTPNYAGGVGYCAAQDSDWAYLGTAGEMYTPVFSTMGLPSPVLEFDAAYNWIGGSEYFAVEVFDGTTWTEELRWQEDHSPYGPGEHVIIDLSAYGNLPTVQVRFIYDDTGVWAWWICVDSVYIQQPFVPGPMIPAYYPAEYEDSFCVDEIDVCEELQICFDDWTPAGPYPDCEDITYRICLETRLCDPMDENPINDIHCEFITVEFWHDVAINEITSPAIDNPGDILWSWDAETPCNDIQLLGVEVDDDMNVWITGGGYYSGVNSLYKLDLTGNLLNTYAQSSSPGWGWRDLAYDGQYLYGSDSTSVVQIDPATGMATGATYPGPISPCRALAIDPATGHFWTASFSSSIYEFDTSGTIHNIYANPSSGAYGMAWDDACSDGMLWLHDQYGSGTDMIEIDPTTGTVTGTVYTYTQGIAGGLATASIDGYNQLVGLTQGTPDEVFGIELCESGPGIDVWLTCGEQEFCATFENLGTFDEFGCTIIWDLYEYNTDPENPTWVTGGTDTIDLEMGEVLEDYCFATYNFVTEGVYQLVVEIVAPGVDCYLDNNGPLDIGLGLDCCPPESTFLLDPEQPNGENNWYVTDVEVAVSAVDCCDPPHVGSGVLEIRYKIDGVEGVIAGDSGTLDIEDDGVHLVEIWAIDIAGNEEEDHHTFEVAIDATNPIVDLVYEAYEEESGWKVDFTASASDGAGSGIAGVEFFIGSSSQGTLYEAPFTWTVSWQDGYESEDFEAVATDNAGNEGSDSVDGGGIEAVPYFNAVPAVPVSLVQQLGI
jgi:hypothetical protein